MKETIRQIVAGLLILCLVAPFSHFHSHESDSHCHAEEVLHEVEACCVNNLDGNSIACACEYEYHIEALSDDCELCEYIVTQRQEFTMDDDYEEVVAIFTQDFPSLELPALVWGFSNNHLGRAPPVC